MKKDVFKEFTQLYPVTKTIRFSLKPDEKTKNWIQERNFLKEDEERAEVYKKVKSIIDEYHKYFIEKCLSGFSFSEEILQRYATLYHNMKNKNTAQASKKEFENTQNEMRKEIADCFKKDPLWKNLFKKQLINEVLPEWLDSHTVNLEGINDPKKLIEEFKGWTTYFGGFNENRKNFYAHEDHATAISYRIIHENLPRFIDNGERYQQAQNLGIDFSPILQVQALGLKNLKELDDIFSLNHFNYCLTQEGIEQYNAIRGGVVQKDHDKGINQLINEFSQQKEHLLSQVQDTEKEEIRKEIKTIRSCKLQELYKQILSDRSEISFRGKEIKTYPEIRTAILKTFQMEKGHFIGFIENEDLVTRKINIQKYNIFEKTEKIFSRMTQFNSQQIYIRNGNPLTEVSKNIFGDRGFLKRVLRYYCETEKLGENAQGTPKVLSEKEQDKWLKTDYFSFSEIHSALEKYIEQFQSDHLEEDLEKDDSSTEEGITRRIYEQAKSKPLYDYFKKLIFSNEKNEKIELNKTIIETFNQMASVLKNTDQEGTPTEKETAAIKDYLDAVLNFYHFLKPLQVMTNSNNDPQKIFTQDSGFYNDFNELLEVLTPIVKLYNQVRNFMTKKTYSVEKYKLNFENQSLTDGWAKNKEEANGSIILRKEGIYFLAIIDKQNKKNSTEVKKLFNKTFDQSGECYEKMEYEQVADASKDIQNLVNINGKIQRFTKGLDEKREQYCPKIQRIKEKETYKGNTVIKEDLHFFIDYYKECARGYWDWCDFKFRETQEYSNFKEFTDEINSQGYKISFVKISKHYIDELVDKGYMYLFKIHNKDFSTKRDPQVKQEKKYKDNIHTMYWRALFDPINLKNVVYKLNGEAELFFRKASIIYDKSIWETGHHDNDPRKKQNYPIIKDRRYAQDTYLFHVPITLNFSSQKKDKINSLVNYALKENREVNIIGIDRGERHLAYYTIINKDGEILQDKDGEYLQGSLNNPLGKKDYQEILTQREDERDKNRKSWQPIRGIKDLKEGYLSQVVHKIVKLMWKYNAIVVFEDLNFGFKQGRFRVERQVYQKLEKMLINKLNYLIFKDHQKHEVGGLYRALQLTDKFTSFKKMGKQTGFIFYVPAYHTSKVCPATGFVNLLYPFYQTVKKSQEFLRKFDNVRYNSMEGFFEFEFDYRQFPKTEGVRPYWILCTKGERLANTRNAQHKWETKKEDLTQKIASLLDKYEIHYKSGENIRDGLIEQVDSKFFKSLFHYLRLTLQIRNSRVDSDEDWIISPVKDRQGKIFDSRKADGSMPKNADANGAYHIALKGCLLLKQLRENPDSTEKFKPDLSNKNWYRFIQKKAWGE